MNVELLLACNSPISGEPNGALTAIQVWHEGASVLDIEGDDLDCIEMTDGIFRIEGRTFAATCIQSWAGNWCWNLYRCSFDEAVSLLEHTRRYGWTAEGGAPFLYDSYNDGDRLAEPLRLTLAGDETPRRTSKQERAALAAWNSGEPRRV